MKAVVSILWALCRGRSFVRGRSGVPHQEPRTSFEISWFGSALFLVTGLAANAQSYSIDAFTVDGGGGTSTGGVYAVTGTMGQADAGALMLGGNYSVQGGFWSIIAVVPSPGAPVLTIARTSTNSIIVSWPASSTNWELRESSDLKTANWSPVSLLPQKVGEHMEYIVTSPTGNRYYRLFYEQAPVR